MRELIYDTHVDVSPPFLQNVKLKAFPLEAGQAPSNPRA
jgi:hypothetical protein